MLAFQNKSSENIFVTTSSLLFILVAFFSYQTNLFLSFLFSFVGLASFFHHTYPKNIYFRISDWLSAICILLLILRNLNVQNIFFIITIFLALLFWVISFVAFHKHKTKIYNISHTIWHILGAFIIYKIFI
jgi:hypothetical protein